MSDEGYTPVEMMVVAAAREIRDGEVVYAGFLWPIIVTFLAKKTRAPNIILSTGSIAFRDNVPEKMPSYPADSAVIEGSSICDDSLFALIYFQSGIIDVSIVSASMVDRFGNLNTTCVGDYYAPKIRLPGAGGAPEVAAYSKRLIIIVDKHDRRKFPERVSFVTSPGYLSGGNSRVEAGYPRETGPAVIATNLGIFRFDDSSKEMYLDSCHPGVTVKEIMENMDWKLRVSSEVEETEPPTKEELRILREMVGEARKKGYTL
ncbi:MAG: CoA-transferase subunit beta [Nitrososphaeria archaeon]|nr:CoA-transferase subunit beta [Nitrososphaeria archaeon]NIN53036.1 CoA-transferase subunit beta [Nitrososphaeria archaeon]NIQ33623.1 CoA-transferase subunit beta [Nitrososphaeria archaeon]